MLTEAHIRAKITGLKTDIRALERTLELCSEPEPKAKRTTRTDQLIAFLQANQPMGSAEISEKSGIPSGTVGAILSENAMFVSKDGRWRLADNPPPPIDLGGVSGGAPDGSGGGAGY